MTGLAWIDDALAAIEQKGRRRGLVPVTPISPTSVEIAGRSIRLFSSNDYLGLSSHPSVREAAAAAALDVGMGPRGASLICGYTVVHEELEEEIERLKGTDAALLFPTGFAANLAVLSALGSPETTIFSDALNHASIIDGCRLSRSRVEVFRHRDVDHLRSLVAASPAARKVVVSDSVFSMEGDLAPLVEIADVCEEYGCVLVTDEAHATLLYGERGGGLAEALGVASRVDFQVGTLSKAVGALGGYVATSARAREWLLNVARPYIFTTALPVPVAAAALAALRVAASDASLRGRLWSRVEQLSEAILRPLRSPIAPLLVGEEGAAVEKSRRLFELGFHVTAIRPPTVPPGGSRLRVTVSAAHSGADVYDLAMAIASVGLTGLGARSS